METVLVLPLYLAVLGGLFAIGDIAWGRIKGHEIDRAAAWQGAALVASGNIAPYFGKDLGVDADTLGLMGLRFDSPPFAARFLRAETMKAETGEADDSVRMAGNATWCDFITGGANLSVGVPLWVSMLEIGAGPGEERMPPTNRLDAFRVSEDGKGMGRAFVLRPRPESLSANLRRAPTHMPAFSRIVGDPWPGLAGRTDPSRVEETAGGGDSFHVRNPLFVFVSEGHF